MSHSRKASNSSLMNRGNLAPVTGSVWAMELAACFCTGLYSVVCSGRGACIARWRQREPVGAAATWLARCAPGEVSPHCLKPCSVPRLP
jgi:hypothetical protein